ncbi:Predicted N-acetyltransferase YhbS [Sporobacter termitidis DSM 10068]|uniref:Predicted N-acetyltransferase YhbS n=1 Tax=Sporobacter termitidis DSM 10068 TaxID=1123282 RepID=A0A1M5WUB9_9FIRM|nr:GNAT family N-acetyltransferase [Sporobacter termitidis]SHH91018.1 Predicted N-acetyltransferase YhbS [Sporobacter termitidis DSM 10068]
MVHICDGYEKMDFTKVTDMLAKAYWSEDIGQDEVMRGASNSALVVGAFVEDEQIGYARAVSDKTRFAYIMDVYVDERYRNQGIGQSLVNYILDHESLKDVYQWLLSTRDAHGLYANCGFQPLAQPQRLMALKREVKNAPNRRLII